MRHRAFILVLSTALLVIAPTCLLLAVSSEDYLWIDRAIEALMEEVERQYPGYEYRILITIVRDEGLYAIINTHPKGYVEVEIDGIVIRIEDPDSNTIAEIPTEEMVAKYARLLERSPYLAWLYWHNEVFPMIEAFVDKNTFEVTLKKLKVVIAFYKEERKEVSFNDNWRAISVGFSGMPCPLPTYKPLAEYIRNRVRYVAEVLSDKTRSEKTSGESSLPECVEPITWDGGTHGYFYVNGY